MTIKELKEHILSEMEIGIKKVLEGEEKSVNLYFVRPNDVVNCVEKLGGIDEEERETNGWQWDYWMYFSYKDNRYSLSGDGFYSDTCSFCLENK